MAIPDAVQTLERDLRGIFGSRLQSLVIYGAARAAAHGDGHHATRRRRRRRRSRSSSADADDLRACAGRVAAWHDAGLATPLLLAAREFERSLDAFPLEFGAILADHVVVSGSNPFAASRSTPPTCAARAKCRRAAICCTCARGISKRAAAATRCRT